MQTRAVFERLFYCLTCMYVLTVTRLAKNSDDQKLTLADFYIAMSFDDFPKSIYIYVYVYHKAICL